MNNKDLTKQRLYRDLEYTGETIDREIERLIGDIHNSRTGLKEGTDSYNIKLWTQGHLARAVAEISALVAEQTTNLKALHYLQQEEAAEDTTKQA